MKVDDAQKIDIAMHIYNLIEYGDACLKTLGILWQYDRHEPALNANGEIIDYLASNNSSASFKFKQQITGQRGNGDTRDVDIMLPLKYLCNFWGALEVPLTNCEISF